MESKQSNHIITARLVKDVNTHLHVEENMTTFNNFSSFKFSIYLYFISIIIYFIIILNHDIHYCIACTIGTFTWFIFRTEYILSKLKILYSSLSKINIRELLVRREINRLRKNSIKRFKSDTNAAWITCNGLYLRDEVRYGWNEFYLSKLRDDSENIIEISLILKPPDKVKLFLITVLFEWPIWCGIFYEYFFIYQCNTSTSPGISGYISFVHLILLVSSSLIFFCSYFAVLEQSVYSTKERNLKLIAAKIDKPSVEYLLLKYTNLIRESR